LSSHRDVLCRFLSLAQSLPHTHTHTHSLWLSLSYPFSLSFSFLSLSEFKPASQMQKIMARSHNCSLARSLSHACFLSHERSLTHTTFLLPSLSHSRARSLTRTHSNLASQSQKIMALSHIACQSQKIMALSHNLSLADFLSHARSLTRTIFLLPSLLLTLARFLSRTPTS